MGGRHTLSHVANHEADAVLEYATDVLKTLGMANWVIFIMDDPCTGDAYASVEPVEGRYVAQIWLADDWMDLADDIRRNSITHEVLHLVHARINSVISDAEEFMHDYEYAAFKRRYMRETELMVDHFATFMSDTHRLVDAWDDAHTTSEPAEVAT